jgi:hypothetical protein
MQNFIAHAVIMGKLLSTWVWACPVFKKKCKDFVLKGINA